MARYIKLKNNTSFDPTKVVSFKKQDNFWTMKLDGGDIVDCAMDEFPWLAKICGAMVEVADDLVINLFKISSFVPNGEGYLVQLEGEEPLQLTKEKGKLLIECCGQLDLAEEIEFLQSQNIENDYKKI